jgi:hypothetical protein
MPTPKTLKKGEKMKKLMGAAFAVLFVFGLAQIVSAATIDATGTFGYQSSTDDNVMYFSATGTNGLNKLSNLGNLDASIIFDSSLSAATLQSHNLVLYAVTAAGSSLTKVAIASGPFSSINFLADDNGNVNDYTLSLKNISISGDVYGSVSNPNFTQGNLYLELWDGTTQQSLDAKEWVGACYQYSTLSDSTSTVPEPSTMLLFGFVMLGIGCFKLRDKISA